MSMKSPRPSSDEDAQKSSKVNTLSSRIFKKVKSTLSPKDMKAIEQAQAALVASEPHMELAINPVPALTMPLSTHISRPPKQIPSIRGVNLGGWLVLEEWIAPDLYAAFPKGAEDSFKDGCRFQLQSAFGKWMSAEDGGGSEVIADRLKADQWETFTAEFVGPNTMRLRAWNGMYVTQSGYNGQFAADRESAAEASVFTFSFVGSSSQVRLQTEEGKYLRATPSGIVSAVETNDPGSTESFFLEVPKGSSLRGEHQFCQFLGPERAKEIVTKHRETFVTMKDFRNLADAGVNAVRIPVGHWIMDDAAPYVAGAAKYLDDAFELAASVGIRIVICLHAPRGSQNGFDHSAPRSRFVDWPKEHMGHIEHSLEVIDFLASRYSKYQNLLGIQLLNEPTAWSVNLAVLKSYYQRGYDVVRKYSSNVYVIIGARVGAPMNEWNTFMTEDHFQNVILDNHLYQVHDKVRFGTMNAAEHIRFARHRRLDEIRRLNAHPKLLTLIGEWSVCLPRIANAAEEHYVSFGQEQFNAYAEASAGWFFWNFKVLREGYRHWDFMRSIEAGFLPAHVSNPADAYREDSDLQQSPKLRESPALQVTPSHAVASFAPISTALSVPATPMQLRSPKTPSPKTSPKFPPILAAVPEDSAPEAVISSPAWRQKSNHVLPPKPAPLLRAHTAGNITVGRETRL